LECAVDFELSDLSFRHFATLGLWFSCESPRIRFPFYACHPLRFMR
jgi:hypothetical protein